MTQRGIIILGQGHFEGMPEQQQTENREPLARTTFATMATPEFVGLKDDIAEDITPDMIRAAEPNRLRLSLIDDGENDYPTRMSEEADDMVVDYRVFGKGIVKLALNPLDADTVMHTIDPSNLRGPGARKARRKAQGLGSGFVERGRRKAASSSVEVVEQRLKAMENYTAGSLRPGLETLKSIMEKAEHPGLARKGEDKSRMDLGWIRANFIGNMLEVIGYQRDWNNEQLAAAQKSIDWRLFYDRTDNRHIQNWRGILELLIDYQSHRINLFLNRTTIASDWLNKRKP